jgi:hypothetical protein
MDVLDVDPVRGEAAHGELRDVRRFVGRVVQHLDLEPVTRILDAAHGLDQPVDHVHLVVERQLNRHQRQRVEFTVWNWFLVLVLQVNVHKVVTMPSVDGQDDQDEEVAREDEGFSGCHVRSGLAAG